MYIKLNDQELKTLRSMLAGGGLSGADTKEIELIDRVLKPICPHCDGIGHIPQEQCGGCSGSGDCPHCDGEAYYKKKGDDQETTCSFCWHTGICPGCSSWDVLGYYLCSHCGGEGYTEPTKTDVVPDGQIAVGDRVVDTRYNRIRAGNVVAIQGEGRFGVVEFDNGDREVVHIISLHRFVDKEWEGKIYYDPK